MRSASVACLEKLISWVCADASPIVGDAAFGFNAQHPSPSNSFSAGIAPLALWKLNDQILIEAGVDIGVDNATGDGSGETAFELKIADLSYFLCDYATVGGGLFVVPFGRYHNHFDPGWITKLPDDPLVFSDSSIDPGSELGAFIKGAIPISETKVTYDLYATNGPILVTQDPGAAGTLRHDNFDSTSNSNKTVGGRVGFIPIPAIEVGYSIMYAQVDPTVYPAGFSADNGVDSLSQAVDFEYRRDFEAIAGTIDFNVEEAWQHIGSATYTGAVDPNTGLPTFGPQTFNSDREGGFAQLAYRPSLMNGPLRKIEGVVRFDWLISPLSVPGGEDERRWTVGLDYWILPNAVVKVAYEFDRKAVADSNDVFMLQLAAGF